ncbi:CopG family transcriptional regulator [Romeria aff. gracilis LEGE 07310]|uniref:CopG family transcriptional regulator n=1 Tax=Vasconcelosia minhoensis LEGE 07310 TaxID=915328 RepID=A0A8J7AEU1_9CYAN|nr:CopG family transcriptional regulator [Romeria gracilis]MBE9077984.1 CopG family transcriptional regulator [Romeria aff. gracilis LEGE 07310]
MEIATQLDNDHAKKLAYIQAQTHQDLTEVLNQAIDLYYKQLNPTQKSPLDILTEAGLVGCFEGAPDLSSNYKSSVNEYLDQKYPPE